MKSITVRGIDDEMGRRLRRKADETGDSINATILKLLRKTLDLSTEVPFPEHHDMDDLAGTWTAEERAEFEEFQKGFGRIDEDLWT